MSEFTPGDLEEDSNIDVPEEAPVHEFVLSEDQEEARKKFVNFLISPNEHVLVLQGYAGTGKSTLVKRLMDDMPKYIQMAKLVNVNMPDYAVQMTATTNKAAEALSNITGETVSTIHSFLGLRVLTDYKTGITTLEAKDADQKIQYIIIIDEASMIDSNLLGLIFEKARHCKIMFIGDPAQLRPVKAVGTPVFDAGFTTAKLSQVMRQAAGNPIIDLATQFRETVSTGIWKNFKPDGKHIIHLPDHEFEQAVVDEFTRPDWRHTHSKVLMWTNKCVLRYNHAINALISGDPHFGEGDYAVCNKFVQAGKSGIKTDQMVYITTIEPTVEYQGVIGNWITLDYSSRVFHPISLEAKTKRYKEAQANDEYKLLQEITDTWIDLRSAFAQTVNKSQGSTYDRVYIDLVDISRCNNGEDIARMLYVATSRARYTVYFTGDFG